MFAKSIEKENVHRKAVLNTAGFNFDLHDENGEKRRYIMRANFMLCCKLHNINVRREKGHKKGIDYALTDTECINLQKHLIACSIDANASAFIISGASYRIDDVLHIMTAKATTIDKYKNVYYHPNDMYKDKVVCEFTKKNGSKFKKYTVEERRKDTDVNMYQNLFADFDITENGHKTNDREFIKKEKKKIIARLKKLKIKYTTLADTEHGLHLYFHILPKGLKLPNRKEWEQAELAFLEFLYRNVSKYVDFAVSNGARVLRFPYYPQQKGDSLYRPSILDVNIIGYTMDELEEAFELKLYKQKYEQRKKERIKKESYKQIKKQRLDKMLVTKKDGVSILTFKRNRENVAIKVVMQNNRLHYLDITSLIPTINDVSEITLTKSTIAGHKSYLQQRIDMLVSPFLETSIETDMQNGAVYGFLPLPIKNTPYTSIELGELLYNSVYLGQKKQYTGKETVDGQNFESNIYYALRNLDASAFSHVEKQNKCMTEKQFYYYLHHQLDLAKFLNVNTDYEEHFRSFFYVDVHPSDYIHKYKDMNWYFYFRSDGRKNLLIEQFIEKISGRSKEEVRLFLQEVLQIAIANGKNKYIMSDYKARKQAKILEMLLKHVDIDKKMKQDAVAIYVYVLRRYIDGMPFEANSKRISKDVFKTENRHSNVSKILNLLASIDFIHREKNYIDKFSINGKVNTHWYSLVPICASENGFIKNRINQLNLLSSLLNKHVYWSLTNKVMRVARELNRMKIYAATKNKPENRGKDHEDVFLGYDSLYFDKGFLGRMESYRNKSDMCLSYILQSNIALLSRYNVDLNSFRYMLQYVDFDDPWRAEDKIRLQSLLIYKLKCEQEQAA